MGTGCLLSALSDHFCIPSNRGRSGWNAADVPDDRGVVPRLEREASQHRCSLEFSVNIWVTCSGRDIFRECELLVKSGGLSIFQSDGSRGQHWTCMFLAFCLQENHDTAAATLIRARHS